MNLSVPRYEIDFLTKEGKVDRNWYKYLALLGHSTDSSTTFSDDIQIRDILGSLPTALTQQQIGQQFYPQTDAERAAGVGPANYAYPPGNVLRYGAKGDGATDDSAAFIAAATCNSTVVVPQTGTSYVLNSGVTSTNVHWMIYGKLTGPGGLAGVGNEPSPQLYEDTGLPTSIQPFFRIVAQSKGNNTTPIGVASAYFEARDRTDVDSSNKGVLYALSLSVVPGTVRNNVPNDDVDGLTVMNTTGTAGAKATDAIYVAHNFGTFPSSSEWYSGLTIDGYCDIGVQLNARYANYGIDMGHANLPTSAAIRIANACSIYWRNASDTGDVPVIGLDANNIINLGGTNVSGTSVRNWFGTTAPAVIGAATYAMGSNDNALIFNGAGCTVTLPVAGSYNGRTAYLKTTVGAAVISASANVVPLAGGPAATAILAASAGKWAYLQSDGANWHVMAGN